MSFQEFKRKMELLTNQEKEFVYALTIEDAINFLKTIKIQEKGNYFTYDLSFHIQDIYYSFSYSNSNFIFKQIPKNELLKQRGAKLCKK